MNKKRLTDENYLIENKRYKHQFKGSSIISKEYNLSDKIGEGTFGVVFKATSRSTKNQVAIKKILVHTAKDGFPTTSIREITFLKLLNHSNIVELVDMTYGEENSLPMFYMVFPYMDHDLTGLLERPDFSPPISQIKLYMQQLCQGTAFIHSNGVLHRDMKASNILISNDGTLKIADFGLARICHKLQHTHSSYKSRNYTNMVVTRFYRPPELILGEKNSWGDYGPEIDIWGVGCIFAEMFTHKPILQGHTDIDQLKRIFELCGDPTPLSWPGWESIKGQYDIEIKTSGYKNGNLRSRFTQFTSCDQSALNLLEKMLTMDPRKRVSARDALNHDYFWSKPLPMNKKDVKPLPSSHEYDTRKQQQQQHQHDKLRPIPPQLPHLQSNPRINPYAPQNQQSANQFSSRPAPAYRPPAQPFSTGSMFSGRPPPPSNFRSAPRILGRPPNNNSHVPPTRPQVNPYAKPAPNQSRFNNIDKFKKNPPAKSRQDKFGNDMMDYGEPDPSSDLATERRSPRHDHSRGYNRGSERERVDDERSKSRQRILQPPQSLPPKPLDKSRQDGLNTRAEIAERSTLKQDRHLPPEPEAPYALQSDVPPPPTSSLSSSAQRPEHIERNSGFNYHIKAKEGDTKSHELSWDEPSTSQHDQNATITTKYRSRNDDHQESNFERTKTPSSVKSGRDVYPSVQQQNISHEGKSIEDRKGDRPTAYNSNDYNKHNHYYNSNNNSNNKRQSGGYYDRHERRQSDFHNDRYDGRQMDSRDRYDNRQHDNRAYGPHDRRDDYHKTSYHHGSYNNMGRRDGPSSDSGGGGSYDRRDGSHHGHRYHTPTMPYNPYSSNDKPLKGNKYEAKQPEISGKRNTEQDRYRHEYHSQYEPEKSEKLIPAQRVDGRDRDRYDDSLNRRYQNLHRDDHNQIQKEGGEEGEIPD